MESMIYGKESPIVNETQRPIIWMSDRTNSDGILEVRHCFPSA